MIETVNTLKEHLSRTFVGKSDRIDLVIVALLSEGHVLLEDVPGVGKTLLAKSLARAINGKFQRVQCTPDLLPTDITGTSIWNPNIREFEFLPGPAFANVLLADEINRATPRTQSALLEVMEEHQITVDGESRKVPEPFFVIATQNPVEYQGTFPLPEAQMDRFAICLTLGYPTPEEELKMLQMQNNKVKVEDLQPCITLQQIKELQKRCTQVKVKQDAQQYIINIVRGSRADGEIVLGVSPRGALALQRASQVFAFLKGRDYAEENDVKELAPHVLSHRIISGAGKKPKDVMKRLLSSIPTPSSKPVPR